MRLLVENIQRAALAKKYEKS